MKFDKYICNISVKKRIIIGIIIVALFISVILYYKFSDIEDPGTINVNAYELLQVGKDEITKSDKIFNIKTAVRVEKQEIGMESFLNGEMLGKKNPISIFCKTKNLLGKIDDYEKIKNINTICIPKGVQVSSSKDIQKYLSSVDAMDEYLKSEDAKTYMGSLHELKEYLSSIHIIEEYSWQREYKKYLSDNQYTETNIVIRVNDKIIHSKITTVNSIIPKTEEEVFIYLINT